MRLDLRHGLLAAVVCLALALPASAFGATVGYAGDQSGDGWYSDESSLTQGLVTGGTFGQIFSTPVVGQVYGQPLVSNGVLFVTTEDNRVYGLDPASGAVLWSRSDLGPPFNADDLSCGDLWPHIGITGTPVIDSSTGTAYFFSKTYESGDSGPAAWYAHAVDVRNGQERTGFPTRIGGTAQNNPKTTFDATHEMQRPALLLLDGVVYAGFGGHCDRSPYQGWVVGVSTSGQQRALWVDRSGANQSGAGIWQSGGGLISDGPGQILFATGNGGAPTGPIAGHTPPADLGESVVRLSVQKDGTLAPTDFFAPYDATWLDAWDADLGSGAPILLPSGFGTPSVPRLVMEVGKEGYTYLLDASNLGGSGMGAQQGDAAVARLGPGGGVWSRPSAWSGDGGYVYVPTATAGGQPSGSSGYLYAFKYGVDAAGAPRLAPAGKSTDAFAFASSSTVITSDGTTSGSGIVWVVWAPNALGTGAQLRAYSAVPQSGTMQLLYSAPIGTSSKFAPPGVAAGRLYVGTRDGSVIGFGAPVDPPLTASSVAFPDTVVGSSSQRTVTLTAARPVTVTGVSTTNPSFSAGTPSSALPATLATGDTISVPVTFNPTSPGITGASLQVSTSSTQVNVGLSGNARSQNAELSIDPPALSFSGTRVGGHATSSVTLTNVGGAPLTLSSVALGDAAGPFSIADAPAAGTQIPSGGSIVLDLHYDPTTTGSFTNQLDVTSDGGDQSIGISGTSSTPPQLDLAPAALDFGSVPLGSSVTGSFTITNSGGTALTITRSKPPTSAAFTPLTSLPEGTSIAPGASQTVSVRFTPSAAGPAHDVWSINGDDGGGVRDYSFDGAGVAAGAGAASASPAPVLASAVAVVQSIGLVRPPSPSLSRLRVARGRVSFDLTSPAEVQFAIEHIVSCARHRRPCARYRRSGAVWSRAAVKGRNAFALGRSLPRGAYRLLATPARGAATSVRFKVSSKSKARTRRPPAGHLIGGHG